MEEEWLDEAFDGLLDDREDDEDLGDGDQF